MSNGRDETIANPDKSPFAPTSQSFTLPTVVGAIIGTLASGSIFCGLAISEEWLVNGQAVKLSTLGECYHFAQGGVIGGLAGLLTAFCVRRVVASPARSVFVVMAFACITSSVCSVCAYYGLQVIFFGGTAIGAFFRPH